MATRKRHSPEQVVRRLTIADWLLAEGKDVATVSRGLGVSDRPITRWRDQFGELKADDAKRPKEEIDACGTIEHALCHQDWLHRVFCLGCRSVCRPGESGVLSQVGVAHVVLA